MIVSRSLGATQEKRCATVWLFYHSTHQRSSLVGRITRISSTTIVSKQNNECEFGCILILGWLFLDLGSQTLDILYYWMDCPSTGLLLICWIYFFVLSMIMLSTSVLLLRAVLLLSFAKVRIYLIYIYTHIYNTLTIFYVPFVIQYLHHAYTLNNNSFSNIRNWKSPWKSFIWTKISTYVYIWTL